MRRLVILFAWISLFALPSFVSGEERRGEELKIEFSMAVLTGPEEAEFQLVLNNNESQPVQLEFPSSQKYEIIVKNQKGKEIYRYSKERAFLQVLQTVTVQPNEPLVWTEKWNYRIEGNRVQEGDYQAEAYLKAKKLNGKLVSGEISDSKPMAIPGENPVFKNVKGSGERGKYQITGQARPLEGTFYYTVEDGHRELIPEQTVKMNTKYPSWSPFTITVNISSEELPENASLILNLYERSEKDGSIIHSFPVLLERF